MALELDTRQRAMLQEMGVQVWLPESGVAVLEQAPPAQAPSRQAAPAPGAPGQHRAPVQAGVPPPSGRPAAVPEPMADGQRGQTAAVAPTDWTSLAEAVRSCQACGLCAARSQTTLLPPGQQVACDWMVVGDVPDEDEERAGAPFAGADGVLLANMLRALGVQRANPLPSHSTAPAMAADTRPAQRAYVSNVLKCRPARGAMPQASELAQCAAHLQQEIALVQPKMILAMGRFANQVLLSESPALAALPLGKLRGSVHRYLGLPVVVTYPPKLLMRNSADKAKAWADLCLAAAALDNATPH
ncbi:MAG: uracil-DNA glycosylase [Rhodoferax sp.]|nr:uracil-DNA glycosylase [Rhodoferax sp.]